MRMKTTLIRAAVLALLAPAALQAVPSFAAEAAKAAKPAAKPKDSAKEQKLPVAIRKMMADSGVSVVDSFMGAGGLQAYVMEAEPGDRRLFYVMPDGKHIALGIVFNEKLENLSNADVRRMHQNNPARTPQAAAGRPSAPSAPGAPGIGHQSSIDEAYARMQRLDDIAFIEGAGHDIYVIFDPSCPYCHRLYQDTREHLGRIRLHWIPVANISPASMGLVQALYESSNKSRAMADIATRSLKPSTNPPSEAAKRAHTEGNIALASTGATGVPVLLYSVNNAVQYHVGAPSKVQLDALIAALPAPARR